MARRATTHLGRRRCVQQEPRLGEGRRWVGLVADGRAGARRDLGRRAVVTPGGRAPAVPHGAVARRPARRGARRHRHHPAAAAAAAAAADAAQKEAAKQASAAATVHELHDGGSPVTHCLLKPGRTYRIDVEMTWSGVLNTVDGTGATVAKVPPGDPGPPRHPLLPGSAPRRRRWGASASPDSPPPQRVSRSSIARRPPSTPPCWSATSSATSRPRASCTASPTTPSKRRSHPVTSVTSRGSTATTSP